jgi:hypothetical protein
MASQINIEELKALIANSIRQENLHDALPSDAVEKIKDKILALKKSESAKEIPSVVSEEVINEFTAPVIPGVGTDARQFPDETEIAASEESENNEQPDGSMFIHPGSAPTEEMSNPTMGYTPELPDALKKAEPAEVFVFQYSDLNKSGENLSLKPLRLMDDPEVQMSMNDFWIKEGKTKADVYVAKFEKIGEINFNYADGVSKFVENGSEPDYAGGEAYKENPYEAASVPQIDSETKGELETYIKNSVDLEKVVNDIVMNVLKTSLMNPTELNKPEMSTSVVTSNIPAVTANINEEFGGDEEIEFNITMKDIVESESYQKIDVPSELNEKINSGDKSMLIRENSEVQEWEYNGSRYYTPIGRISKSKGYIKS